nr:polysaccharide biosynthesis/export family protein [uncultured Desulfobacter sp.]
MQRRFVLFFAVLALFSGVFGCSSKNQIPPENIQVLPLNASDGGSAQENRIKSLHVDDVITVSYNFAYQFQQNAYRLQISDTISVKYTSLPNLNTTQTVTPDGRIFLPYIGSFSIAGKTLAEATQAIKDGYAGILWEPELFLELTAYGKNSEELKNATSSSSAGQTQSMRIRKDGKVSLSGIGEIQAAGKTLHDFTADVNDAYKQQFNNVQVSINLQSQASSYYYVLGEVRNPGIYTTNETITTLQLLAMAGGTTSDSVPAKAVHLRVRDNVMSAYHANLNFFKGSNTTGIHLVEPGDILYVPKSNLSNIAHIMGLVSQTLMFKGISYNIRGWDLENDD